MNFVACDKALCYAKDKISSSIPKEYQTCITSSLEEGSSAGTFGIRFTLFDRNGRCYTDYHTGTFSELNHLIRSIDVIMDRILTAEFT